MYKVLFANNDMILINDSVKVEDLFDENEDREIIFCVINKNSRQHNALFKIKINEINKLPQYILNMRYGVPYGALFFAELLQKNFRIVFLLFDDEFFKRRLLTDDKN